MLKRRVIQSDDFVPYRESTLTWLLRDSLCGNALCTMLAALSPARTNFNETMSTLRFAERAKTIVTQAITNDDPMQKLVRELQAEVERLKNKGGAPLLWGSMMSIEMRLVIGEGRSLQKKGPPV